MTKASMKGVAAERRSYEREILEHVDVSGPEPKEVVLGLAELAPGTSSGRHSHSGYELTYVIAGTGELRVDGEPPRSLEAGDSYHLDGRKPHDIRNTGTTPMKGVVTWVVEKGKPFARTGQ